jgi:hypothetical protein
MGAACGTCDLEEKCLSRILAGKTEEKWPHVNLDLDCGLYLRAKYILRK